jgi:hypothetical protein
MVRGTDGYWGRLAALCMIVFIVMLSVRHLLYQRLFWFALGIALASQRFSSAQSRTLA